MRAVLFSVVGALIIKELVLPGVLTAGVVALAKKIKER